ncbi:MAG: hypothetical protein QXP59_04215 [Saccharolobus sp.]
MKILKNYIHQDLYILFLYYIDPKWSKPAYMFLNVLAYRLIAALEYKLENISNKTDSWERAYDLLRELGKIE